jgi:hypothetical protein
MVHLVPSRMTYTTCEVAELVFSEVYKLHGLPKSIISDQDILFTSGFWTHLQQLIGVKQRMSSAYHPETNGATKCTNCTVNQMLRSCISPNQRDWVSRLPAIEFAINIATSESIGYSPFFTNYGWLPRPMIWDKPDPTEYPGVRAYAQKLKHTIMSAHDPMIAAHVKQTRDANRCRRPCPLVQGDLVYLSTKNISFPKGLAHKFLLKFMGPYQILNDFGNNSYHLELPDCMKQHGIHDVFHSSYLRLHMPNNNRLFPGRLDNQVADFEDKEHEWAVEKILSHKGT